MCTEQPEHLCSAVLADTRCGLGSTSTDRLVQLVLDAGPAAGLYGAKITGGGSGGSVCVLSSAGGEAAVKAVAAKYEAETGHRPHIFRSSSIGGEAFGCLVLENTTQ
jgi:galactokinase